MALSEPLIAELDVEAVFTRRHLERVPMDRLDFTPHLSSMTLGWLATFLAIVPTWGDFVLTGDSFDVAPAGAAPPKPAAVNHMVHHRAQLGVYLRLNDVDVPAVYNGSADEQGGMFMA